MTKPNKKVVWKTNAFGWIRGHLNCVTSKFYWENEAIENEKLIPNGYGASISGTDFYTKQFKSSHNQVMAEQGSCLEKENQGNKRIKMWVRSLSLILQ